MLDEMGLHLTIHDSPNEMPEAIPFREDTVHVAYGPAYAQRFWRVLLQADTVRMALIDYLAAKLAHEDE